MDFTHLCGALWHFWDHVGHDTLSCRTSLGGTPLRGQPPFYNHKTNAIHGFIHLGRWRGGGNVTPTVSGGVGNLAPRESTGTGASQIVEVCGGLMADGIWCKCIIMRGLTELGILLEEFGFGTEIEVARVDG